MHVLTAILQHLDCNSMLSTADDCSMELMRTTLCLAGKLLAFSGPSNIARVYYGFKSFFPDDYHDYFRKRGISAIVRLNKPVSVLCLLFYSKHCGAILHRAAANAAKLSFN